MSTTPDPPRPDLEEEVLQDGDMPAPYPDDTPGGVQEKSPGGAKDEGAEAGERS